MNNYLDKTYASILGMCIGIRLGAMIEPVIWDDKLIKKIHGDVNCYLKPYKKFAADDDSNGPLFFIRRLYEQGVFEVDSKDIGETWLNFSREGIGMFWWGGVGVSTEHTAYCNLLNGINAPVSGLAKTNGKEMSEQIGGQIFIDSWGWIYAGQPSLAAKYAMLSASVSHDGEGLEGAKFIAAAIAKAYVAECIEDVYEMAMAELNKESLYYKLALSVRSFYQNDSEKNWRNCLEYLLENWGYDKYTGVCHIIPNAGVCMMSLLYGAGDFNQTIEISVMAGMDTDCNGGNVGSIIGAFSGRKKIDEKYLKDINDNIVASSFAGSLNIVDIPTVALEMEMIYNKLLNKIDTEYNAKHIDYNFELYGSTHGVEVSDPYMGIVYNQNTREAGENHLNILLDRLHYNDEFRIYLKNFYTRDEFDDERYKPVFSPRFNTGQTVKFKVEYEKLTDSDIILIPYVKDSFDCTIIKGTPINEINGEVAVEIPELYGSYPSEIGLIVKSVDYKRGRALGLLQIDRIWSEGNGRLNIDFAKQEMNFNQVTPFSHNLGTHFIFEKAIKYISEEHSESFTGNYYNRDCKIRVCVKPIKGNHHFVTFRAKGLREYYSFGFNDDKVVLIEHCNGRSKVVLEQGYKLEHEHVYELEIVVKGEKAELFINEQLIFTYDNLKYVNGCVGYSSGPQCTGMILFFEIEESDE